MRLQLEPCKPFGYAQEMVPWWRDSEPFVLNDMAVLIHRPRQVTLHHIKGHGAHLAVKSWCGASFTGSKKFTFLSDPPQDRLVCHACEERALMAGLPSSSELAGRHVCTGKLKAVNSCHAHKEKIIKEQENV